MAEETGISWTDATFNPWWGCSKVSPACDNCYAERDANRFAAGQVLWGVGTDRRTFGEKHWNAPRRWAKTLPAKLGRRPRVFCASMADVFDKDGPAAEREKLWALMTDTPELDWLLLTKRIGNVRRMVPPAWLEPGGWPKHVRLMISVVNQEEVDRDVPKLVSLGCPNGLSMEPLLGPVSLRWMAVFHESAPYTAQRPGGDTNHLDGMRRLDWVIVGGESGPDSRPLLPAWAYQLRDQCAEAGVPFHFKQWGEWGTAAYNTGTGLPVFRQFPCFQTWVNKARTWVNGGICLDTDGDELMNGGDMARARDEGKFPVTIMHRVGKRAAGRLLDGVEHNGFPS